MVAELLTPRLDLRPSRLADAAEIFAFTGDPVAMRYTRWDATLKDCRQRLAAFERRRRRDGFAAWTVRTREDGRVVGWGGLYIDPFDPDWGVELGYHFHPIVWGKGYATELATAALALADGELALPEVLAFAHPDNRGSIRVLEKVGFERLRWVPEMERHLYRRRRPGRLTSARP